LQCAKNEPDPGGFRMGMEEEMNVSIYYGGRGLLDDPTLYVLNKMEEVLRELRVNVERINIYEHKNEIATLPQTMRWHYSGYNSGVAWYWWIYAAVSGCLLALWRQGKDKNNLYAAGCNVHNLWRTRG